MNKCCAEAWDDWLRDFLDEFDKYGIDFIDEFPTDDFVCDTTNPHGARIARSVILYILAQREKQNTNA